MRVRGPGAAGERQVRLLERRGRDGVRLLGELAGEGKLSELEESFHFISGEEENNAEDEAPGPRECHH